MMKYVLLLIIATLAAAIFALDDVVGVDNTTHAQAGTPSNVSATNGANPGEAVVSWDPVAGASEYRVGWLAVADYQANIDNDQWRERFVYSDVNANSSYTVTRLTPGIAYYFITGRKEGNDIVWSAWATLTLNSGALSCPTQPTVAPSTTSALRVANGSNPGEVVVSWDVVTGTTGYRVGWLAVPDYRSNIDNDRWRERFAYSDINPSSSYTVTRLTPGIAYYFILGRKQGDNIAWSQWAALILNSDPTDCPLPGAMIDIPDQTPLQTFPASPVGGDYDHDDDGLIEVRTLAQLDVIRLDPDGDARLDAGHLHEYLNAFAGALDGMGCPADGCKGYEQATNLNFDTNGNGQADAGDDYWNDGAGWDPIALFGIDTFYRDYTFDGNGYEISNLYIARPEADYVGLFSLNYGTIQNVVLGGVDVRGNNGVGSLVGLSQGPIIDSTAGGTVSGSNVVGGLVGLSANGIVNCSTSGTVSAGDIAGGLVGVGGAIFNGMADSTISGDNVLGGLVGYTYGFGSDVTDSTASGSVSGKNTLGGLVGQNGGRIGSEEGAIAFSQTTSRREGGVGYAKWSLRGNTASGGVSGNDYVGGLVGRNSASIKDNIASGTVSGNHFVGGLVGRHEWYITEANTATGDASGNKSVGGLIGYNYRGTVSTSYATGDVVGQDIPIGGLIGLSSGNIRHSYAIGDVSGLRSVGGLVGYQACCRNNISASYAAGKVSGGDGAGGLLGGAYYAFGQHQVVDSYWDINTSGQTRSSGGQGRTTAELQSPSNYTGIYVNWNVDLDNADEDDDPTTGGDDPWDFGTSSQYPVLKYGGLSVENQRP